MTFLVLLVYIGVVCVAFAGGCDAVAPVIDDVQPSYGSIGGGTLVTISGKNLMREMKSSSDPFKKWGKGYPRRNVWCSMYGESSSLE